VRRERRGAPSSRQRTKLGGEPISPVVESDPVPDGTLLGTTSSGPVPTPIFSATAGAGVPLSDPGPDARVPWISASNTSAGSNDHRPPRRRQSLLHAEPGTRERLAKEEVVRERDASILATWFGRRVRAVRKLAARDGADLKTGDGDVERRLPRRPLSAIARIVKDSLPVSASCREPGRAVSGRFLSGDSSARQTPDARSRSQPPRAGRRVTARHSGRGVRGRIRPSSGN
jgi:hypothetical protein